MYDSIPQSGPWPFIDGTPIPGPNADGWLIYQVGDGSGSGQLYDQKRWIGKIYTSSNYPTWDDTFQEFNQSHFDHFGIGIDRKWSSDSDSVAQKLMLDTAYINAVKEYNAQFNKKILVDTRFFGPNVQPNPYTPKPEFHGYLAGAMPMIGIALAVMGVPLLIGDSAIGAVGLDAAAMPLASQAVGNMAMATAMNGGDVSKAANAALLNMIASNVGDYAGSVYDSANIGKAAQIATQSVISGKTPSGISLITSIGDVASATFTNQGAAHMGDNTTADYSNLFTNIDQSTQDAQIISDLTATASTDLISLQDVLDANNANPTNDYMAQNDLAIQMADTYNAQITQEAQNAGVEVGTKLTSVNGSIVDLSLKDANSFLKDAGALLTTVKALKNGTPVPYINTTMPVGVPQLQSDGSYRVNNGNGTVTTHYASGSTQTAPLVASGAGLSSLLSGNMPLYIGGAVLALLILKK